MRLYLPAAVALMAAACGSSPASNSPRQPGVVDQWITRARASYRAGDFDDAHESVSRALAASGTDQAARLLGAKVALATLDFAEAKRLTEGIETTEAHSLRGRAAWYSFDLEAAADALEASLADPNFKDPWARGVTKLARAGSGRRPYQMEGGPFAVVPMERIPARSPEPERVAFEGIASSDASFADVISCNLEGVDVLAVIATGASGVIIDSAARHEPAWVNLMFGQKGARQIEVKDVPALSQDLSPLSRELGIPVTMLIGADLLRHLHVTFDRRGDQFIVRSEDPSPPPDASRIPLYYIRGGAMVTRAKVSKGATGEVPMLVDSARFLSVGLSEFGWKAAEADPSTFVSSTESAVLKKGIIPSFVLGGFELPAFPALSGIDFGESQAASELDLGGVIGGHLLAFFRVTIADGGRFAWLEADPSLTEVRNAPRSVLNGAKAGALPSAPAATETGKK